VAELIPAPFPHLLRRMLREAEAERKVLDLPERRFWRGAADLDLSVVVHGKRAANPAGPAAGPHGQMAQNVLLSWLAGSRFIELKTVQVNDRLTIPRPCIDMETVGYNVEWSQELRLVESLREYVKGSMLIDVARAEGLLGRPDDPARDDTVLDMSVGYDLAGLRSEAMRSWIASMKDARAEVNALRREIPGELARLRELDFRTGLSDQVTLSTFHGCPAEEIERIVLFLMEEMDLHVTVKLNPTLLGKDAVDGLLHDVLGYEDVQTRREDFDKDLQWASALEMTDRLAERARSLGRELRLKLSNTLVVRNHRGFFPAGERTMYLSGPPLHVITLHLVERLRRARPGVPLSFSAGVDNRNFPDCVALGLAPVTVCTDLLRPGGYSRLPKYLENLEERMRGLGVRTVDEYIVASLDRLWSAPGKEHERPRDARTAAVLSTPLVASRATSDARYRKAALRPPRRIGRHLVLFDCLNCDKCLPACPNDANFVYEVTPIAREYESYRAEGGRAVPVPGGRLEVRGRHQIATFQDFCNDCGNCDTFCPEDGGPYVEKPRLFGSVEAWRRHASRDGFFVRRREGAELMWGRFGGVSYRLVVDEEADQAVFTDGRVTLELRHRERRPVGASVAPGTPDGHTLDVGVYLRMATILDGVLDARRANPVNSAEPFPEPARS
jgi:putative selenate reductase